MGCLFVLLAVFFRVWPFIVWVARPNMVNVAFGSWVWPLLGTIFLPFATLMSSLYMSRRRFDRVGLVLGCLGRHPRYRALG